jgi:hypothetical protein
MPINLKCVQTYRENGIRPRSRLSSWLFQTYVVLSESSWTVIVVTASLKEDERGGQGHTSESLLHQSAT